MSMFLLKVRECFTDQKQSLIFRFKYLCHMDIEYVFLFLEYMGSMGLSFYRPDYYMTYGFMPFCQNMVHIFNQPTFQDIIRCQ